MRILLLFLVLILSSAASAQPEFVAWNGTGPRPGQLFAAHDTIYSGNRDGVDVSTDQGLTWSSYESDPPVYPSVIASWGGLFGNDDNNQTMLFDAASRSWRPYNFTVKATVLLEWLDSSIIVQTQFGLRVSTDRGKSWKDPIAWTYDVAESGVHYKRDENGWHRSFDRGLSWLDLDIPASTLSFGRDSLIIGQDEDRLIVSFDGGSTWLNGLNAVPYGVLEIEADDSNIFYTTSANRIYRSLDTGKTWHSNELAGYASNVLLLGNGQLLVSGGGVLYKGTFENLKAISTSIEGKPVNAFDIESGYLNAVFVGNYGLDYTLARSAIGSASWEADSTSKHLITKLWSNDSRWVAAIGGFGDTLLPGLYYSDDKGVTWIRSSALDSANPPRVLEIESSITGSLFALCSDTLGLIHSTDRGLSWSKVEVAEQALSGSLCITRSGTLLLGTKEGVISSTDEGQTWKLHELDYTSFPTGISGVGQDKSGRIYAAGFKDIFWTDDLLVWSKADSPFIFNTPHLFTADSIGNVFFADRSEIAYSQNGGGSWKKAKLFDLNNPNFYATDIIATPDGNVYVGTNDGVYRTKQPLATASIAMHRVESCNSLRLIGGKIVVDGNISHADLTIYDQLGRHLLTLTGDATSMNAALAVLHRDGMAWIAYELRTDSNIERGTLLVR